MWACSLTRWQAFLTWTYDEDKLLKYRPYLSEPSTAELLGLFQWWVKMVNTWAGGGGYKAKWGHSYFSYLVVTERGKRFGRLHLHGLVDNYIDFHQAKEAWWARVGHLEIDSLWDLGPGAREAKVLYLAKYATKGPASPVLWIQPERRTVTVDGGAVRVTRSG